MSNSNKGLEQRYNITKTNGKEVHPDAKYFVLRYDGFGDHCHVEASRKALRTYAEEIRPHLPKLAEEIFAILKNLGDEGSIELSVNSADLFDNLKRRKNRETR